MKLKNNNGFTLVELLVTIAIAFTVLGLASGILMQSFKNMEIADTNINLRQEANILLATITSAHMSKIEMNVSTTYRYPISYTRINSSQWELQLGTQVITDQNYDIELVIEQKFPNESTPRTLSIDTTTMNSTPYQIEKKLPLNIKKLILINKKDNKKKFEISTIISRL
jgi:prepilin-type N-terminal cleavage/methylation domain-containing protein